MPTYHLSRRFGKGCPAERLRLDLSDDERAGRRRKQQEAYRRRKGIQPKKAAKPKPPPIDWAQEYFNIWGEPPGVPLTKEEFAEREPLWNARIQKRQAR